MNRPNVAYDPKSQNRMKSNIDFSNSSSESGHLTEDEQKRVENLRSRNYKNNQFGKSSINSSFVPDGEIKKLQKRVSQTRQSMGFSNISLGEQQKEENPPQTQSIQASQVQQPVKTQTGSSSLIFSTEKPEQEKRRPSLGYIATNQMLHENLNNPVDVKKGMFAYQPSRIGEEHLDEQLVPPPYEQLEYKTRIGEEHLNEQLVPQTDNQSNNGSNENIKKRPTKMCEESEPITIVPKSKNSEAPKWTESQMSKPLPPSQPRRQYPNNQSFGHANINFKSNTNDENDDENDDGNGTEWKPNKIKVEYPLGHQFGKSNIGSHLGISEINKPPIRRGSYQHNQYFNQQSLNPSYQKRPTRMGESNMGGLLG